MQLHPVKTRIAYCADANRRQAFDTVRFDFLGYTFKPRQAVNKRGRLFTSFSPAAGDKACKAMRQTIRQLGIDRLSRYSLEELSIRLNTLIERWVRYYGLFHRSALQRALCTVDLHIVNWAMRKLKRLRGHKTRAWTWLAQLRLRSPHLFLHWTCDLRTVGR